MEKNLSMKIKAGQIEIEVAGEDEVVKEQFDKAVMAIKEILDMQMHTGKEVADDLMGKLLGTMLDDLKK